MFCNILSFYSEELLAPHPTSKLDDHPLWTACNCLFNMFCSYPPYLKAVPPFPTWGHAMLCWQGPHLSIFMCILYHPFIVSDHLLRNSNTQRTVVMYQLRKTCTYVESKFQTPYYIRFSHTPSTKSTSTCRSKWFYVLYVCFTTPVFYSISYIPNMIRMSIAW